MEPEGGDFSATRELSTDSADVTNEEPVCNLIQKYTADVGPSDLDKILKAK